MRCPRKQRMAMIYLMAVVVIGAVPRQSIAQPLHTVLEVNPVGTPTQNGTALLNALASITNASVTNPWLVRIDPGIYDLGSSALAMTPYVDIEGSGEDVTTITTARSAYPDTGAVLGANNAELRFLTVVNNGGGGAGPYTIGIFNNAASPRLTHVTVLTVTPGGSFNFGVQNQSCSPVMNNVTISAQGGTGGLEFGMNNIVSSPVMNNVTITASGGSNNYAMYNSGSSPLMSNVTVTASGGTDVNSGIHNESNSSAVLSNVTATASGGNFSFGMDNVNASVSLRNSTLTADGATTNYGISNYGNGSSYFLQVKNAQISGGTNAIFTQLANGAKYRVGVALSQLAGGPLSTGVGITNTCIGAYDGSFARLDDGCHATDRTKNEDE